MDPVRQAIAANETNAVRDLLMINNVKPEYYDYAVATGNPEMFRCIWNSRDQSTVRNDELYSLAYADFLIRTSATCANKCRKRSVERGAAEVFVAPRSKFSVPETGYACALGSKDINMVRMMMRLGVPADENIRNYLSSDKNLSGYDSMFQRFMYLNHCRPNLRKLK